MLRKLTYALAAVEAVFLLSHVAQYALDPPGDAGSGGPQMGLFFFVLLPLLVLTFAILLFRLGHASRIASGLAMLIVASPLFGLTYWGIDAIRMNHGVAELDSGRGYFTAPRARALGEAIVSRDLPAVTRLAALTDVNAEGEIGTTFLKLALRDKAFDLGIVHALLAAGANPNQDNAWPVGIAIYYGSAPLLALVLTAGGDPNTLDLQDIPVSFQAVERPELLPQLLAGGARIEATDFRRRTMLLEAARERNWDAANILLDHEANRAALDRDGKGAIDLLHEAQKEDEDNEREVKPGMSELEARLRQPS